jgi:hypothetical protein
VYSNFTPRSGKYSNTDTKGIIFFGLQGFIKEFLIESWNKNFFKQNKQKIVAQYKRRLDFALGKDAVSITHIEELWDLGYLPIQIKALEEGSFVPYGVPVLTIKNTDPKFFWITNYLESVMSASLWKASTSATTAFQYKKEFIRHARKTGSPESFIEWQGHDFSFRGMGGIEDAARSGAGHLTSFYGTDTISAIDYVEAYYNTDVEKDFICGSVPACYDDQTEILTENGFIKFSELKENTKVAQYTDKGEIEFVIPLKIYNSKYNGKMIQFSKGKRNYVDLLVTPNHRMIRKNRKNGEISFFEAGDFLDKGYYASNNFLISGKKIGNKEFTDLDRLKIAFQADGSFPSRKEEYNGNNNGTKPIRFSLKKERKQNRLENILNNLSYKFQICYGKNKRDGYKGYWIPSSEEFYKDFGWIKLEEISYEWASAFMEELPYWDGHIIKDKNVFTYCSTNYNCISKVQEIAILCGYKTHFFQYKDKRENRKICYSLVIHRNKDWVSGEDITRKEVDYDGEIYCVSVPSTMIIVRRNNVVAICGNSEHSVMCMGEKEKEINTFRRLLTEVYPSGIVSIVSDTWDLWKVIGEYSLELKDTIMKREGKLVFRPDCYSSDTLILTDSGWKLFSSLVKEDKVAQVLDDGTYEFVYPTKYINEYYEGDMYNFYDEKGKLDILVTPNHRMIYKKNNEIKIQEAETFTAYHKKNMIRSAKAKSNGKVLSDKERLMIAFQADGSYVTDSIKSIRFSFSKDRKIKRLTDIIQRLGLPYQVYNLKDKRVEIHIKVDASEYKKDFSWVNINNLDGNWCSDFIEELSYWDATRRTNSRFKFDTTNVNVIKVVELIALSAGYGCLISLAQDNRKEIFSAVYTAHILKNNFLGGQSIKRKKVQYSGTIHCVSVPTGKLIVKRNKGSLVCGNSGDPVKIICGDKDSNKEIVKKGAYEALVDIFGYTLNEKGYKVLNEKVGLIYGDAITPERQKKILEGLEEKGFCASNLVLGIGSYTYTYCTRDTHGFAMKATWGVVNDEERIIFKDPITDDGVKKSATGLLKVIKDEKGNYQLKDNVSLVEEMGGELKIVFENGKLIKETKFIDIRNRVNNLLKGM